MKLLKEKYPIVTSLIFTVIFVAALIGTSKLLGLVTLPDLKSGGYFTSAIAELVIALVSVASLFIIKEGAELKKKGFFKGLLCGIYMIAVSLLAALSSLMLVLMNNMTPKGLSALAFFTLNMFLIGVAEEVMFRGVVARIIFKKYFTDYTGAWFCVITSGLVFGALHLLNGFTLGSFDGVFVQCLSAAALGMMLTAVYYRSGSLWSVIFIHALLDFCALLSGLFMGGQGTESVIASYTSLNLFGILPYIAVTIILMRKSKIKPMLTEEKSSENSKIRLIIIITLFVMFAIITTAATVVNDIITLIKDPNSFFKMFYALL